MALSLALLSASYSNSQQVDTTGNLTNFTNQATGITSTWQNAGTIGQQLTCWEAGGPGYCGPLPRVAAWGSGSNVINFSYGLTDLNQVVNIKNALPNSGTGLQVNGFNFGFQAKNGNGWDNGMQDYLTAYVNIYNNTNSKVLESYNYDLNSRYNWTQFSYSETFKSAYGVPDLGNAQYGFIGKDNNFWVGPYGPEITAVSFSLKYSVDPCANNPLYSTSCRGYNDALAKLNPVVVISEDAPPPPPDGSPPPPPPGSPPPEGSPPPPGSPPGPGPGPGNNPNGPAPSNQPPPGGGGQQPKPGETKTASDNKAGPSLGTVLSMISSNQARIGNEAKSVVQAAESAAAKDALQAQEQAESVAASAVNQSNTTTTTASNTSTNSSTQSQSSAGPMIGATQTNVGKVEVLKSNSPTQTTDANSTTVATFTIEVLKPATQLMPTNDTTSTTSVAMITNNYVQPSIENITGLQTMNTTSESIRYELFSLRSPVNSIIEIETPQLEGIKIGTRSVLNDAIEERTIVQNTITQEQKKDMVNKNVLPNELAGTVDIARMAIQPAGYQSYSVMMPDVAFYAPKEIYKNQVNVDNVRLLRGLGSDRLHQEMVNQQYKLGQ